MSAHNAATLAYAIRRAEFVASKLEATQNDAAHQWAADIREAIQAPAGGTLRRFMAEHEGGKLDSLYATITLDGAEAAGVRNVWAPVDRTVEARATFARLDGSRVDYAGITTLVSTGSAYIGFEVEGTDIRLVAYRTA